MGLVLLAFGISGVSIAETRGTGLDRVTRHPHLPAARRLLDGGLAPVALIIIIGVAVGMVRVVFRDADDIALAMLDSVAGNAYLVPAWRLLDGGLPLLAVAVLHIWPVLRVVFRDSYDVAATAIVPTIGGVAVTLILRLDSLGNRVIT